MERTTIAGWSALAFVACVATINIIENVGTARPDPTAGAADIAEWAEGADAYLWATTVFVPIAWVLLAVLVATVWSHAVADGIDTFHALLGAIGAAMTMGTLSAAVAADAVVISSVDRLGLDVVDALSRLATVLFLFNWVALAVALYGLSRTTVALQWTPRWLDRLSVGGAVALVIGAVQPGLVLNDVLPGLLIGLVGFLAWLVYLGSTGFRLVSLPGRAELEVADAEPTPVG